MSTVLSCFSTVCPLVGLVLDPVRVAHGAMMALAFGLLFTFDILSAHNKKALYNDKEAYGLKIWFRVHRVCMVRKCCSWRKLRARQGRGREWERDAVRGRAHLSVTRAQIH